MQCKDGTEWLPSDDLLKTWRESYPDIEVDAELGAMASWLISNKSKRKTVKGMPRFVNAWLKRASEKGGSPLAKRENAVSTRDMTSLDDLTHNFTGDMRAYFIRKYGQSFEVTKRYKE